MLRLVRRNKDLHVNIQSGPEKRIQVFDCSVLCDALADYAPCDSIGAQEIVLRVNHHQGSIFGSYRESGFGRDIVFPFFLSKELKVNRPFRARDKR